MTNADVVKLLGSGWVIDQQAVVTSANQTDYAVDLTCAALTAKAVPDKQMGQGYLPPYGWTVVVVHDANYNLDYIWIDPSTGVAWVLSKCTSFAVGSAATPPQFLVSGSGEGGGGWILLLAAGTMLWLLLKGK